jgi:ABC-type protease/lipase transport system fused ATPase/permease subunit
MDTEDEIRFAQIREAQIREAPARAAELRANMKRKDRISWLKAIAGTIAAFTAFYAVIYLFVLFPIIPYVGEKVLVGVVIALLGVYVWNKRK